MTVRTVVFDMDGTLVQTRKASWEIFQDTARRFDLPVRSADEFFALFEDNFFKSLGRLIPDPGVATEVRTHFMTALKDRYEPDFVPGMVDVIKALAPHYALAVMSSNSMDTIRRILEVAGVAQCFAHVFSAEVGTSKRAHLERVLLDPAYGGVRQCSPSYVEAEPGLSSSCDGAAEVVLITDTVGDVEEATSCGTRAIGVAWGMHSVQDLRAAGAERVVYWPQELVAMLLPDGVVPAAGGRCAAAGACGAGSRSAAAPDPAAVRAQAEQLGRLRHVRRVAAVSDTAGPCRCGLRCGLDDDTHGCGRPRAAAPPVAVSAGHTHLLSAIARIAGTAP